MADTQASGEAAAATASVTDADIAAIVVAANTADIEAGKQALAKSQNDQVREFAQRMITDHGAVNKNAVALVTKLGVTPTSNATSEGMTAGAEKTRQRLDGLSGAAFDSAYINNEVAYHQTVLDALDSVLIPSAQNAELKSTLVDVRPAFVAHLEHAKKVQASLATAQ